ncbi:hypothetical protein PsorP6_001772 [Peronosclerospora sorghi]|uniref:Uncharacterized protein n=1 Tax=Peronosclerospora sorghi TaxID=230839 RepID=A0ACC0WSC8_9STRA|nr:hypothetical protein PsorP6_001772 [Peronosclerospora sorghi]
MFGNSLVFLEEERFRKMSAKHYPSLLNALRKEVTRWIENEDGEFDLSVLGEDLKTLLLEMIHTDTGLEMQNDFEGTMHDMPDDEEGE